MVYSKRGKSTKKGADTGSKATASTSGSRMLDASDAEGSDGAFDEVEDYAIIRLNTKGEVMSWNKGAEKIKGYRREEIIGKHYRIFYTAEDKETNLSEKLLDEAKNGNKMF